MTAAPVDRGTLYAERHRVELVNGSDQALAAAPIGVLLANGHITREQARAGEHYAALRAISFGMARPSVAHDQVEPYDPRVRTDAHQAKLRRRFEEMAAELDPDQKRVIDTLLIDQRLPPWFWIARARRRLRPSDERERQALIGGLEALAGPGER